MIKLDLGQALDGSLENDISLQGLDRVQVYSTTGLVPRTYASITGHVKNPGSYLIQENMTLYDLIFKAGGFLDEEFKKQTFLERADLVRLNDDNITRFIKTFNLGELLDSPESALDLPLQSNDIIGYIVKTFSSIKNCINQWSCSQPWILLFKNRDVFRRLNFRSWWIR